MSFVKYLIGSSAGALALTPGADLPILKENHRSAFSRDEMIVRGVMTKRSRSKYAPHYGAKEAAKYAARAAEGRGL